ncbi:beta-1,3-glucan-binding protein-like [Helicoverpa zea]|uniref:beta-1,3-glucan-binding protein-like n=1 Tax=Helicoverpa zea TaxID=7113 RepID=UPI001F5A6640|nr:beta-1,3-glucan-binding protein-like [Helicoverpa zea]
MARVSVLFLIFVLSVNSGFCYEVPAATLEAIYPKGLRVSIPDDGFSLFAFHGNLNEEMNGLEAGRWSRDITKQKNGRWTFRDRSVELKVGDTIYFWTYVIKDGLGYRQDNGEWTVTGYVDEAGNPVNPTDGSPLSSSSPVASQPSSGSQPLSGSKPSLGTASAAAPASFSAEYPCELSISKVNVPGFVCRGQLLFEDNFNSGIEKGKIWTPEIKFPGEPDFPFNVYLNDRNLHVRDGRLSIKPITLESKYGEDFVRQTLDITARCTGTIGTMECSREASGPQILPPIITSKITTKNKFAFKYGRIEISAKLPLGDWIYPEIQLEPRDHVYGIRNYASGLLRIATIKGNAESAKKLYAGPIMCDSEPYRSAYLKEKAGSDLWSRDFHNYSLEWRPDGISLFVDGEKYGEVTPPTEGFYKTATDNQVAAAAQWLKGTTIAPFDDMFYISLGLNVGGVHEFPDADNKPWKNRATKAMLNFWNAREQWYSTWYDDTSALQVDYVRVYAL